ncbi:MAG: DUF2130 domain-containing protein [Lachnospiraceae bacterium]|nr:DUF2130 domain-containing protein [Lachnospiraceae bacterium]
MSREQIRCPHCGEVFTIDETNYDSIVKQIRDHEFQEEIRKREQFLKEQQDANIRLLKMEQEANLEKELAKYKEQVGNLKRDLIVQEEKAKAEQAARETEKQLAVEKVQAKLKEEMEQMLLEKDKEIEKQQELVQQYKDFKARQSTKMVGESLEQHCAYEFNKYRMGMFPQAYFEKDNDARTGSKGDFIFRDYDADGETEIISIMFEMKNENETTATKHKNEDFLKELDKDRNEKGCEYAILVSLLEADNELYNEGIVDVSYRYPKMYVIRPQFFIPIITILRNAALNTVSYKKELALEKEHNLDITHFEENMEDFKQRFGKNYELAARKFKEAIEDIDKTIKNLEKTKAALLSSENNLRLANNKAQDLSIKKLTKNAPSLREQFEALKQE